MAMAYGSGVTVGGWQRGSRQAFTLIELLVVIAIIGLLISILLPSLSNARQQARAAKCLSNLRVFGQGLTMYLGDYRDVFVPGRLPKIDECNAYADIFGRRKFRPTFVAMMSPAVGAPPFEDPMPCDIPGQTDRFGQDGDRQDYAYEVYVCPSVAEWTDERNGAYGYNYQFLGNSRLFDDEHVESYKNWPVRMTQIRYPARTVAVGDCMGTAAGVPEAERSDYTNNGRIPGAYGDEGFNMDPPRIDLANGGEIAGHSDTPPLRSAAHPRHREMANILWVDGHASAQTLEQLGYRYATDGSIGHDGDNTLWSGNGLDLPWTPEFQLAW
jgi:prepilin-type N-terminal cleavage/methylation domain-containing protein/prepilin-type processing-associated H-X9-DG protein